MFQQTKCYFLLGILRQLVGVFRVAWSVTSANKSIECFYRLELNSFEKTGAMNIFAIRSSVFGKNCIV